MPWITQGDKIIGHLHAPESKVVGTRVLYCPRCKRRRRVEVRYTEWYGLDATCTAIRKRWKRVLKPCGYRWSWD